MVVTEQEPIQKPEVQPVPEQFSEDVAERLAEQGISTTRTQPQKLTDDQGQTVVQPTATTPSDDDIAQGIVVPFGEEDADARSKGSDKDASTWLAVWVKKLYRIARHTHRKIFIRK